MKTFSVQCSCGMKGCVTELVLSDDEETPKNVLLTIKDDKHEYASFVSINHESAKNIVDYLRKKYKLER